MVKLKTYEDIKNIQKANKIIANLYENVLPKYIKAGISTYELDKIIEDYILSNNAIPATKGYKIEGFPVYPSASCISVNEVVVHGIPRKDQILKEGDIVSIDVVTNLNGYFGDSATTFAVGNISEKNQRLIEVTRKSRDLGIEQAIAGNRLGDIANAIQEYVEKHGFSVIRDFTGHGVGFSMHEDPYVLNYGKKNTGLVIENGLVIAIEPMVSAGMYKIKILKDGWSAATYDKKNAAHFEHSVAIWDNKPLILSNLD